MLSLYRRAPVAAARPVRRAICRAQAAMSSTSIPPNPTAEDLRALSCSCVGACSTETPKVPEKRLDELMVPLPLWSLGADRASLHKSFVAKNFVAAVTFFNKVAEVAEEEGHHPDLHLTGYRNVEVVLSTHAINGLAYADFVMAAKIDALPVDYSPKWLKQQQAAQQGQQQQQPGSAS